MIKSITACLLLSPTVKRFQLQFVKVINKHRVACYFWLTVYFNQHATCLPCLKQNLFHTHLVSIDDRQPNWSLVHPRYRRQVVKVLYQWRSSANDELAELISISFQSYVTSLLRFTHYGHQHIKQHDTIPKSLKLTTNSRANISKWEREISLMTCFKVF